MRGRRGKGAFGADRSAPMRVDFPPRPPSPMGRLRSRYAGRYEYHWSRLLLFAAMDAATTLLMAGRRRRTPREGSGEPRRILVIRVDGIGDVIAMLPAVDTLRADFPRAEID